MFWGTNSLVFFCTETALLQAVNDLIPFRLLGVCVTFSSSSLSESHNQNWFLPLLSNCFFFVFISSALTTLLCSILQGQSLTLSFGLSCITLVSSLPSQLSVFCKCLLFCSSTTWNNLILSLVDSVLFQIAFETAFHLGYTCFSHSLLLACLLIALEALSETLWYS